MSDKKYCPLHFGFAKIYCLHNSRGKVFYVGCTIRGLKERLNAHFGEARTGSSDTCKTRMIKRLKYRVYITELERVWVTGKSPIQACVKARNREVFWIKEMVNQGYYLTNKEVTP